LDGQDRGGIGSTGKQWCVRMMWYEWHKR
jgi:hypothetical protein